MVGAMKYKEKLFIFKRMKLLLQCHFKVIFRSGITVVDFTIDFGKL